MPKRRRKKSKRAPKSLTVRGVRFVRASAVKRRRKAAPKRRRSSKLPRGVRRLKNGRFARKR